MLVKYHISVCGLQINILSCIIPLRCWLPSEKGIIFAFIGPMVAIIVVCAYAITVGCSTSLLVGVSHSCYYRSTSVHINVLILKMLTRNMFI